MLGAALVAAVVLGGLLLLARDPDAGRARESVTAAAENRPSATPESARASTAPRDDRRSASAGAVPSAAEPVEPPPPGRRRGVLRGAIELPAGTGFTGPWTVRLERSRVLRGRERAVPMSREYAATEREFRFDDVPLAGYDVVVEAEGFFSRPLPVLLVETAADVYVVVDVRRAGSLEGRVLDEEGAMVEALTVTLAPADGAASRTTLTRADGTFRFDELVDGAYTLTLGPNVHPYAEPLRVAYTAPSLDVGTLRVPVMHGLIVRVVDDAGRPVEGARVRGLGERGGVVDTVTDARGEARAALLVAGEYRLRAEHPEAGRVAALEAVVVGGDEPAEITLELVRP